MFFKIMDVVGAIAFASVVFWAFTGMPLWTPIDYTDFGRGIILFFLYAFFMIFPLFRRIGQ